MKENLRSFLEADTRTGEMQEEKIVRTKYAEKYRKARKNNITRYYFSFSIDRK